MRKNSGGPLPASRMKLRSSRGGISSNLDVTEDSEVSEYEVEGGTEAGVRYITESLIQKVGGQESLALVTSLNLSLAKDGGKKFKFIENLEKCEKLEVLNLSYNLIQKMEKLEKLTRLRELNLAHNRISKIEGVEHMQSLQKLNLAGNEIEHIPVWLGKKMKALRTLNLGHNKIFSLHDGSRLKPLRDLTSLCLGGNPVADLPQYRLCTIFHLRSLSSLDGQPITNQERHEARDRFNLEEVERLERELEKRNREMEELQGRKEKVLSELQHQGELNTSLRLEVQQQKKSCKELEREMDTKNELLGAVIPAGGAVQAARELKQKTLELTRACQKQYELEQELAFYKIDAKFEPLGYMTSEEVDAEEAPEESPYIGKARYKRNLYTREGFIPQEAQHSQEGRMQRDGDHQIRNQQIRARILTTLDIDLTEKEKHLHTAETKLAELQSEILIAEQQILRASGELKELEDAVAQRKMSEAEKDGIRQQLRDKIRLLDELRQEAQALEREMDAQRREMDKKVAELEELQRHLDSLSPSDPRHAHVRAQKASKEQQLEMMDRQYRQLEGRLDDMLSRIARETEEIKDLEQQLTEGQIAANEALKRDLEGIISGLQEYLESVKDQARRAQEQCRELQAERPPLLQRLKDLEEERERLEGAAKEAEDMRKELQEVERSLQEQQELNASLQQSQGDLSAYEDQLEERLRAQEAEMAQLTQELERRKQQGQVETSALRSELENALSKGRMLEESAQDNKRLRSELHQLQRENESLGKRVKKADAQLEESLQNMVHPDHITSRVSELKRKLQTGVGEMRPSGPSDVLGQNLAELQQQVREILGKAEEEKRECRGRQSRLQEEMAALQEKAKEAPGDYKRACDQAAEARVQQERRQGEAKVRRLEREVQQLNDQLRTMEEIQGLADQQLVEAEEERERLLAVLHDLQNERRSEDARAQQQLSGLGEELKELKRAVATSDKMATSELTDTKEQLCSLHGTVLQINRERAEEMEEAESFCAQAAQAARDLAKAEAEIELLQELLQEKERQLREEPPNADPGAADSQQLEMQRLRQTLRRQRAEIDRLRHALDHLRADNAGEIDNLLEKIDSLRSALGHQNDYITSMADPFRRRGYWYYMPSSSNNSGRDSLSTKDSGVSVHCPMNSSPARRKSGLPTHRKREEAMHAASGRWVYSPFHHAQHRYHRDDDIDGASQSDSDSPPCHMVPPPGSVIYTVFPDGSPAPQGTVIYGPPPPSPGRAVAPGTVIYGPPPQGTQLVYGPPPAHFTLPVIPAGVLHCNVSAHHHLENEVSRLEDIIDHLRCVRRREKKSKTRLAGDIEELECRKEIYRKEVEDLRNAVQRHKRRNFLEGHLDALITELELERSLRDHHHLEDEIECVEKTLLKRRAELREADRLLAEAEGELKSTQGKTAELVEKYNMAKKHLSQTESDAEELESRAQDTALHLLKAEQQLQVLQAESRELEQRRAEQENVLQEINSIVSTKDAEFQSLSLKVQTLSDSLQTLQSDIQEAEGKEDRRLKTLKEAESLLLEKRLLLDRLTSQISAQQEEVTELDRLLGQKKEEAHLLQEHTDQRKAGLNELLREGKMEAADRRQGIKELQAILDDLGLQRQEVCTQLAEEKSQLSALKQEAIQEEEKLQKLSSQIHRQKSELKHVLEMQQLEDSELRGLKVQHEQKMADLEKTQSLLLQGELESVRRTAEGERQRQRLEKEHREVELLTAQARSLQEKVETLSAEKDRLERTLAHTKRTLGDTEKSCRAASSTLENLQCAIKGLQSELTLLRQQRQETVTTQQTLQETREKLNSLKDQLTDREDQLQLVEQDLRSSTEQRDDLLREHSALKEEMAASSGRWRVLQEEERRQQERLRQLQGDIQDKERHLAQQEENLKLIREQWEHELGVSAARREELQQEHERELSNRQNALDAVSTRVTLLEERAHRRQREGTWCGDLEEALVSQRHLLAESEEQLREKTNQIVVLQKEAELYREQLSTERKRTMVLQDAAAANQHLQLEHAAEEHKMEVSGLRKRLLTVERGAYDNHERATRLLRELQQLQAEHAILHKQLRSQEDLDKRQQEVNEAVKELKAQVKREIQNSLQELHCAAAVDELQEEAEPILDETPSRRSQLESLRENFPFSANCSSVPDKPGAGQGHMTEEQRRGDSLREQLRQQEDRLKVQLLQRMSKQADVLNQGRRQTEGSLHSLRRQVDALDELVSNLSEDSPFLSHNSSGALRSLTAECCSPSVHTSANLSSGTDPARSLRPFSSQPPAASATAR